MFCFAPSTVGSGLDPPPVKTGWRACSRPKYLCLADLPDTGIRRLVRECAGNVKKTAVQNERQKGKRSEEVTAVP